MFITLAVLAEGYTTIMFITLAVLAERYTTNIVYHFISIGGGIHYYYVITLVVLAEGYTTIMFTCRQQI